MSFLNTKPSEDYAILRRQFRTLCQVADGLQRMMTENHQRYASKAIGETPAALDGEREINQRLTNEVEALQAQVSKLEQELRIERRPIRNRRLGSLATCRVVPYLGLPPKYQRYGEEIIACLDQADHDPDFLNAHIGEPFAYLRHDIDQLSAKLTALDRAVVEWCEGQALVIRDLPRDHPFRGSARRHATWLSKQPMEKELA